MRNMDTFCSYCGARLNDGDSFCTSCGNEIPRTQIQVVDPVQPINYGNIQRSGPYVNNEINPDYALSVYLQFLSKLDTAATTWMVIGIIQIVIGFFTLIFCYGVVPIILGIWNITQSSKSRRSVNYLRGTSKGAVQFIDSNSSGVAALVINIIFGALIGVIAAAMDMSARNFGKSHRQFIWYVEQNGWYDGCYHRPQNTENWNNQTVYGDRTVAPIYKTESIPDEVVEVVYENVILNNRLVIINKSQIMKDPTGNMYLENEFRNNSGRTITAIKLDITGYDPFGGETNRIEGYTYVDMSVPDKHLFGKNIKIPLNTQSTRSIAITITGIIFSDGEIWTGSDNNWEENNIDYGFRLSDYIDKIEQLDSCKEILEFLNEIESTDSEFLDARQELEKMKLIEQMYGNKKESAIECLKKHFPS